jgi:hypothetical protein
MKWWTNRHTRSCKRISETTIRLAINGDDVIGPMTLESLALMTKLGSWSENYDILQACLGQGRTVQLYVSYAK